MKTTITREDVIYYLCRTAGLCKGDFAGMNKKAILNEYDVTEEEVMNYFD